MHIESRGEVSDADSASRRDERASERASGRTSADIYAWREFVLCQIGIVKRANVTLFHRIIRARAYIKLRTKSVIIMSAGIIEVCRTRANSARARARRTAIHPPPPRCSVSRAGIYTGWILYMELFSYKANYIHFMRLESNGRGGGIAHECRIPPGECYVIYNKSEFRSVIKREVFRSWFSTHIFSTFLFPSDLLTFSKKYLSQKMRIY